MRCEADNSPPISGTYPLPQIYSAKDKIRTSNNKRHLERSEKTDYRKSENISLLA